MHHWTKASKSTSKGKRSSLNQILNKQKTKGRKTELENESRAQLLSVTRDRQCTIILHDGTVMVYYTGIGLFPFPFLFTFFCNPQLWGASVSVVASTAGFTPSVCPPVSALVFFVCN